MLRFIPLVIALTSTTIATATHFIVQDPCTNNAWLNTNVNSTRGQSVGAITLATLKAHSFPFEGSEQGIRSIRKTVTGDNALEVISDSEMRAYGWCFHVNGVEPDVYPDQILIQNENDLIEWFFGFAHYKGGAWISTCNPTSVSRPDFICKKH